MNQCEVMNNGDGKFLYTISGDKFYFDLTPEEMAPQFKIEDIAHALSFLARYCGHTIRMYPVSEHSLLIAEKAMKMNKSKKEVRTALLHDAPEAYIVDLITQLKKICPAYKVVENKLEQAISIKYNTIYPIPKWIKELDVAIRLDEMNAYGMGNIELSDMDTPFIPLFGIHQPIIKKLFLEFFHRVSD